MLKASGVSFRLHAYVYEPAGGTRAAATRLGVDEHTVVKTLAMEDEKGTPFLILMHGDRQVSTKKLARRIAVKSVRPCDPESGLPPHRVHGRGDVSLRCSKGAEGLRGGIRLDIARDLHQCGENAGCSLKFHRVF